MDDRELRALVRAAVTRHLGSGLEPPAPADASTSHPSHRRLSLERGAEGDGACLIEPSVRCVHCGYCQSYGH